MPPALSLSMLPGRHCRGRQCRFPSIKIKARSAHAQILRQSATSPAILQYGGLSAPQALALPILVKLAGARVSAPVAITLAVYARATATAGEEERARTPEDVFKERFA